MDFRRSLAVLATGVAVSVSALAHEIKPPAKGLGTYDPYAERRAIMARIGSGKESYLVGLFPGVADFSDGAVLMQRYLPLANYLTAAANAPIVFIAQRDGQTLQEKAKKQEYAFVYGNGPIAVAALRAGYTPVVKRGDSFGAAILVRSDAKYQSLPDLAGQRLDMARGGVTTALTLFDLVQAKVYDQVSKNYVDTSQQALVRALKDGLTDAIVIRDTNAHALVANAGGSDLRILHNTAVAPGFMLLARLGIPDRIVSRVEQAMLRLDPRNAEHRRVLEGFDSAPALLGSREPFVVAHREDLAVMSKVLDAVSSLQGWRADRGATRE